MERGEGEISNIFDWDFEVLPGKVYYFNSRNIFLDTLVPGANYNILTLVACFASIDKCACR